MDSSEETNRLGAYLRARRDLVTPEQAGIAAGLHHRVLGLRREEVAMLAGSAPTTTCVRSAAETRIPRSRC